MNISGSQSDGEIAHDHNFIHLIKKKYRIGILTSPSEKASVAPISNLIEILKPISEKLVIITGNAPYDYLKSDTGILCYDNGHPIEKSRVNKIFNYLIAQFKGSLLILKQRDAVDIWIFFMGGEREFLPILTAKILKKPTLLILTGSIVNTAKHSQDPFLVPIKLLNCITSALVSGILLYSPRLISEVGLDRYIKKIYIAQRHFIDLEVFQYSKKYEDRPDTIGYIGRLSEEKGVLNFVNAIPRVHSQKPGMNFFIGGDGELHEKILKIISSNRLEEMVTYIGWIPHDKLPKYLNNLKLLVLPSYTEGLPNIILEAMACGTPVLVTPVGAIRDVIKNEETGFILNNNSPETIGDSIVQILNHPNLKTIACNGRFFIDSEYSFQKAVESYSLILSKVLRYPNKK
jgi:glycosyltransferase involved in cell wall biosynthesis